jgi:Na+-transporting NADH:ubiquinone oxidoreductase subunit D
MATEVRTAAAGPPASRHRYIDLLREGVYKANPVAHQVLGICIFLAVTNRVANSIVMGIALTFVTALSSLFVSLLRRGIPPRIRLIVEMAIIATWVIVLDQFMRAFYWDMSRQLGPYVALIIVNCIVLGRSEGFALQHAPLESLVDGFANGVGYLLVLTIIGTVRQILGAGTFLNITLLRPEWYTGNLLLLLAPGAFFTAGFLIWTFNTISARPEQGKKP